MKHHRPSQAGNRKYQRHFGLHLTLDGYWAHPKKLNDLSLVSRALRELSDLLGMKRLIPPYVVEVTSNKKNDPGGYSGFVIIQESHISIHTFPRRRFVSIDVYSCKDFKTASVVRFLTRIFRIRHIEKNIVVRGRNYPVANLL